MQSERSQVKTQKPGVDMPPQETAQTHTNLDSKNEHLGEPPSPSESTPKNPMPKRLIALMLVYTLASISGLLAKQGVLFCLLTLFMVLAVFARQKAGLWFLRGYTLVQLAMLSMLPFILDQGDNVATGPNTLNLGSLQVEASDYTIFAVLILAGVLQVLLVFTPKVGRFFTRAPNFNIMN